MTSNWKTYQSYGETPSSILGSNKNLEFNGRVNLLEPANPNIIFEMQEKIHAKNTSSNYYEALIGTWEANVLAQVFFAKGNIDILQNGLRAGVFEMSKGEFSLPPQNIDALKIIMRSVYMQHAEHHPTNITQQVERLNELVLKQVVPMLYSEAKSYMRYRQDQSTLVVPLNKPLPADRIYKQLEHRHYI